MRMIDLLSGLLGTLRLDPLGNITADKRFTTAHPSFLTEASFIHQTLSESAIY